MYRFGFIIEQALGHITHGHNLQHSVALDPSVEAHWGFPTWDASGLAALVPNWTVKAGLQARQQVAEMSRETALDALFFHTQVTAVLSQKWLKCIPSVISLDATPRQYDELGQSYQHESGPDWLEQQKWRLNRNAFSAARHLVSWSHWAKAGLSAYEVSPEKVTVIPPGVNIAEWSRPEPRRYQAGPVKILFVGADLERKGGNVLLEAFRRLDQNIPAARLHAGKHVGCFALLQPTVQPGEANATVLEVALVGLLFAQQCSIEAFFGNVYTEDVLFHHLAPSLAGAHLLPDSLVN